MARRRNLSIVANHASCPSGMPIAVVDDDTTQVLTCAKTMIDAQKARAMAEGNDPTTDPALFDRGAGCACCTDNCACGDCEQCTCDTGDSMGTVMYSLPKTIGW